MSNDAKREVPAKPLMLCKWLVVAPEYPGHKASITVPRVGDAFEFPAESEGDAAFLSSIHNAAIDEIERLQGELARLQAAVDAAGGLCECGHTRTTHASNGEGCLASDDSAFCECEAFAPRQAPAEGKGEGEQ